MFAKKTLGELLGGKQIASSPNTGNHVRSQSNIQYANQRDYDFDVTGITEANAKEMQRIKADAVKNGTFMKAPNGKPTNLNERQWLQVRTEAFKTWFGDLELKHKTVSIIKAALAPFKNNAEAKQWAVDNGIVGIFNSRETGEYEITASAIDKYLHTSSVRNSESRDVHYSVLRILPEVINNSVIGETHLDYRKKGDIRSKENEVNPNVRIHRLYGAVTIEGENYRVKTTLKEYIDVNQISKPYTYEVTKIELIDGKLANTENGTDPNANNNSISAAKLLNGVEKSYEKGKFILDDHSKVVDANGEPLAVAHSTNREFTVFKNKQENDSGWLEAGYYFFGDRSLDGQYGKNVIETFLNIRNPYYATGEDINRLSELNDNSESTGFTEELRRENYDGVYYNGDLNQEIVAFSPNQIKSATDNNGNFDNESDDIRFQFIGEQGASALDKAEEATTRMDNLNVARRMEEKFGVTEKEWNSKTDKLDERRKIKLATGWERGADGKWRYEMPDVEWNDGWYDLAQRGGMDRLSAVVESSELFKAYPSLHNVAVILSEMSGTLGAVNDKGNTISLNNNYVGKENMLPVMAHEIQHIIQRMEGFARGSNPDQFDRIPTAKEYNKAATFRFFLDKWMESNDIKARTNTSAMNKAIADYLQSDAGKFWNYDEDITAIKNLAYDNNRKNLLKYRDEEAKNPSLLPQEQYMRTAGEVEARNASRRMDMTVEERRASLAADTEDVAREDQLFIYDGLGNSPESNKFAENNEVNGNEEKKKRIEKLRNSSPIEITGEEITPSEDLKQYKANALEYGKSLRGEYINKDTGERITLTSSKDNGGLHEILHHDYKDKEHLQSIAAIPQIIENSIFIDEIENTNPDRPNIKLFRYYASGLKIGGVDYTVKSVISETTDGNRYYDHKLTSIEKGKLIDLIDKSPDNSRRISSQPLSSDDLLSDHKDKRLFSILQTNNKKPEENSPESGIRFHAAPTGNPTHQAAGAELDEKINS
ncbi:MAG: hypothetical protein LBF89_06125, partial [Bacteroidales bacterium]|nr:hypothetical protein [Bacteroidales bacterium]